MANGWTTGRDRVDKVWRICVVGAGRRLVRGRVPGLALGEPAHGRPGLRAHVRTTSAGARAAPGVQQCGG
jgi:hypothetical protein